MYLFTHSLIHSFIGQMLTKLTTLWQAHRMVSHLLGICISGIFLIKYPNDRSRLNRFPHMGSVKLEASKVVAEFLLLSTCSGAKKYFFLSPKQLKEGVRCGEYEHLNKKVSRLLIDTLWA